MQNKLGFSYKLIENQYLKRVKVMMAAALLLNKNYYYFYSNSFAFSHRNFSTNIINNDNNNISQRITDNPTPSLTDEAEGLFDILLNNNNNNNNNNMEGSHHEKEKEKEEDVPAIINDVIFDAQELETFDENEINNNNNDDEEEIIFPPLLLLPESNNNNNNSYYNNSPSGELVSVQPISETCKTIMMHPSSSYLCQQDMLYLSFPTPPEARLPLINNNNNNNNNNNSLLLSSSLSSSSCIMVVFNSNDLRIHDNYNLALASVRAHAAGGLPIIAIAIIDYRTFAQPSAVGGFFRQSPKRAQFFLETLLKLRETLENELQIPLLIRCGRPEEHIPRLALECGAIDIFLTTQYAPHEKKVHDRIIKDIKNHHWISRDAETGLIVTHHDGNILHPYYFNNNNNKSNKELISSSSFPIPHSVWQTTLIHFDDLPVPVAAMSEGERWYHDDITIANIRPTKPYDNHISKISKLPKRYELLPSPEEQRGIIKPPVFRGNIPTLSQLGYGNPEAFIIEEIIATESSHPPGEKAAIARVQEWLESDGMTSQLRHGREKRTNTKMYSQKLSRISPYISNGSLSPRRFYEMLRTYTSEHLRDNFVQMQYREALLRLSRRDYWHWMGLKYGPRLFYSYGPCPEHTDNIPNWRHDIKIIQKWCAGLTGIPFTDASMRELILTGFVASEGRKALAWLFTKGYGQDWRIGAEWFERCSLDYDPFICYGNFAYFSELIRDDFGECVRSVHWLAHHHDQTGIYIKKWLPVLSKIPPVYIHRPHILTSRMQAMHGIRLGKNYPYPLKLWDGAQYELSSNELTTHFDHKSHWQNISKNGVGGQGYGEALRHGQSIMKIEEWNKAISVEYIRRRPWVHHLPTSAFESNEEEEEEEEEEMKFVRVIRKGNDNKQEKQQEIKMTLAE